MKIVFGLLLFIGAFIVVTSRAEAIGVSTEQPSDGTRLIVSAVGTYYSPRSISTLYVPEFDLNGGVRLDDIQNEINAAAGRISLFSVRPVTALGGCSSTEISPPSPSSTTTGVPNGTSISFNNLTSSTNVIDGYKEYCVVVETDTDLNEPQGCENTSPPSIGADNCYAMNVTFKLYTTGSQLLGNYNGGSQSNGTGYYQEISQASAGNKWNKDIEFAANCSLNNLNNPNYVANLYDLDTYQGTNDNMRIELQEADRGASSPWFSIPSTLGNGGSAWTVDFDTYGNQYYPKNVETGETVTIRPSGNYQKDKKYRLIISEIGQKNKVRIRLPFDQISANRDCEPDDPIGFADSCRLDGTNTVIYGWAYDDQATPGDNLPIVDVGGTNLTTQQVATSRSFRPADINIYLDGLGYGSNARDDVYGFEVTFSNLTKGTSYALSGTVYNLGAGSLQPLKINLSSLPPSGDTDGTDGFGASGTIPDDCLNDLNSDPTGSISMTCAVTIGTNNATLTVNYSITDADGDQMTVVLTNPDSTTSSFPNLGNANDDELTTIPVSRGATYYVSATVTDGISGVQQMTPLPADPPATITTSAYCEPPLPPNITCAANAVFTPTAPEVNRPFSFTVSVTNGPVPPDNDTLPLNPAEYIMEWSFNGSPFAGIGYDNYTPPLININESPRSLDVNIGGQALNNYNVQWRFRNIVNANAAYSSPTCSDGVSVGNLPVVQAFRGDVIAGYGQKDSDGSCNSIGTGRIRSNFNTQVGTPVGITKFTGSGTQLAAFALGQITGFRTAITDNIVYPPGIEYNNQPWRRAFANELAPSAPIAAPISTPWGGQFNSNLCASNWFEEPRDTTKYPEEITNSGVPAQNATILVNNITPGTHHYTASGGGNTIRIAASAPISSGYRRIFFDGNIIIGDNGNIGTGSNMIYSSSWASEGDIPNLIVLATGNIYIDDDVQEIHGTFVAGRTIFTCIETYNPVFQPGPGNIPDDTDSIGDFDMDNYRPLPLPDGKCYDKRLRVQGSLLAENIRFWRTGGTLGETVWDRTFGTAPSPAEAVRLGPEVFIAPRGDEEPLNGEPGKKRFDSLISLPPTF